ncbi:MAG: alpha/beta hydrolase [Rhodothermus sp.]|nr:alpha/beta hydrolase [Rhodothermus sp.]
MITYRIATALGPLRVVTDGLFRPGPPVVLLHGWTLSPWAWVALMPASIRTQHRWYALSLPGHLPGEAGTLSVSLTAEHLATALAQALQDLVGDEPVHLVGHSLGGFWGLCLAVHRPERLVRLVLLSSFADGRRVSLLQLTRRLAACEVGRRLFRIGYRWLMAHPARFRRLLARLSGRSEVWQDAVGQLFVERVYSDAKRYRPEGLLQLAYAVAHLDVTKRMAAVSCPVLLMAGTKDPVVPVTHAHEMTNNLPKAHLKILPEIGHFPMIEALHGTLDAMDSFLFAEGHSTASL